MNINLLQNKLNNTEKQKYTACQSGSQNRACLNPAYGYSIKIYSDKRNHQYDPTSFAGFLDSAALKKLKERLGKKSGDDDLLLDSNDINFDDYKIEPDSDELSVQEEFQTTPDLDKCREILEKSELDGKPRFDSDGIRRIMVSLEYKWMRGNSWIPQDKMLEKLLAYKDYDGDVFDSYQIYRIFDNLKPDNQLYLSKILDIKRSDGKARIRCENINDLLSFTNEVTAKYIEPLFNAKTKDGKLKYKTADVNSILCALNNNNKELLDCFLHPEAFEGRQMNSFELGFLLRNTQKHDSEQIKLTYKALKYLMKQKDASGDFRFSELETSLVTPMVNNTNIKFLAPLVQFKKNISYARYGGSSIKAILGNITEFNSKYVNLLVTQRKKNNFDRFSASSISGILSGLTPETEKIFLYLLNSKKESQKVKLKKDFKFSAGDISEIMENLRQYSIENFDLMINARNKLGNPRLSPENIGSIVKSLKTHGLDIKALLEQKVNGRLLTGNQIEALVYLPAHGISIGMILKTKSIDDLSNEEKRSLLNAITSDKKLAKELANLSCFGKNLPLVSSKDDIDGQEIIKALVKSLKKSINFVPLSEDKVNGFYKSLGELENILKKDDLEAFIDLKLGLQLEYPRDKFITDISDKTALLNTDEKSEVLRFFNFDITDGQLSGYPCVPQDYKKSMKNLGRKLGNVFSDVMPIVTRFTENNSVQIPENKQLENALNNIISAFPEFLTAIGKKQHGTHAYSLDSHMLKAFQEMIRNKNFDNLSENDKKIAELSILFHDISKKEGIVDDSHYFGSALDVYSIFAKLGISDRSRERIYSLINNHHWLAQLDKSEKTPEDFVFEFRRPGDFEIAKMFTEADLKAVSSDFYDQHKDALESEKVSLIQEKLDKTFTSAIWFPQTHIPKASSLKVAPKSIGLAKLKTQNTVINLEKSGNLESLGFSKGTTLKNFYSIIHVINDYDNNAVTMLDLAEKEGQDGVLSASFISGECFPTYGNKQYGLIFDVDPANIAAASPSNMGSGTFKNSDNFKKYILGNDGDFFADTRLYFANKVNEFAGLPDQNEYPALFKKFYGVRGLNQIEDENLREVMDKTVKLFLDPRTHNELVIYAPKPTGIFVKNSSENNIPYQLRKYAQDNDIPIIIFGKN